MKAGILALIVTGVLVVGAVVGYAMGDGAEAEAVAASASSPMNSAALPALIAVAALFLAWMGWAGYFDR